MHGKWKTFRELTFGNRSQSDVNRDVYKTQRKNGTGWCSKESIAKRNAPKYQSIMQINVAKRGNKRKSIETQIARELHPSQNLKLQSKKAFSIQLRKAGINYIGMHH